MTDPDHPESVPTVQTIWVSPDGDYTFSRVPAWKRFRVAVPFPYRLVADPEIGAAYASLWARESTLGPRGVFHAAERRRDGFRFVDSPA